MRGEHVFASAEEEGDAADMARTTVAFIGMMERFHPLEIIASARPWSNDVDQATKWPIVPGGGSARIAADMRSAAAAGSSST
jgi:hypothetical protein